jgi:signal transduction histidine kinase
LELPFYFENEDIGLGVDWALAFRFGLENRIMAVMILGKKKRKTPYFNYEIESLQRFLKILYRTYEKLELSNQLLAADKNITVSMLAGGIAHEIGNNITPIIGRAELLLNFLKIMPDRELAAKYESQASVIYNQGCKIARMAKNLTKLSRPLKLEVDKLNLEAELRSAVELMAETAGKIKHFKLDDPDAQYILNLNFAPDLPQIRGDSQQLQQVFINLIINAAHAIEDKGRGAMTIGTKLSPDEGVVAFIQDTGCGMSNETMDNMWKPFFTTKKSGKGTGLGMAIVKNVLEAHQAKISVSSKLGEGTIFEIRFEPVKE